MQKVTLYLFEFTKWGASLEYVPLRKLRTPRAFNFPLNSVAIKGAQHPVESGLVQLPPRHSFWSVNECLVYILGPKKNTSYVFIYYKNFPFLLFPKKNLLNLKRIIILVSNSVNFITSLGISWYILSTEPFIDNTDILLDLSFQKTLVVEVQHKFTGQNTSVLGCIRGHYVLAGPLCIIPCICYFDL